MIKALEDLKDRVVVKYWKQADFDEASTNNQKEQCFVRVKNYRDETEVGSPSKMKI
jgi:hypothetical protein